MSDLDQNGDQRRLDGGVRLIEVDENVHQDAMVRSLVKQETLNQELRWHFFDKRRETNIRVMGVDDTLLQDSDDASKQDILLGEEVHEQHEKLRDLVHHRIIELRR